MSTKLLELRNVETYYGKIRALDGVSLAVAEGEIVALIGANGAGKSTTLRTISGLIPPSQGEILFDGKSIARESPHKIVALGISQVPEGRQVFTRMSVLENLEMGSFLQRDRVMMKEDLERVFGMFPILKSRCGQKAGTLSGGEQQMLAIGRALMSRPRILLLDEPSMGLAPKIVQQIFEIVQEINNSGTTIFLVEQNANMALEIADYAFVIETGRITLSDVASNLCNNPVVKSTYLGE